MTTKAFQIIKAVRDRLTAASFAVSPHYTIDGPGDVVVFLDPDTGIETISTQPTHRKRAHVGVMAAKRFGAGDFALEGCSLIRALEEAVYKGPFPDARDTLDGTATAIEPGKADFGIDEHDALVVARLLFAVTYRED